MRPAKLTSINTSNFKLFILFICISAFKADNIFAQNTTCKELKNGIFYLYPKNSKDSFLVHRKGNIQQLIKLPAGDTTFWEIEWIDDCVYSSKFLSGGKTEAFYKMLDKKHKELYNISSLTNDYYIYNFHLDSISDVYSGSDTIWLKPKIFDNRIIDKTNSEYASFPGGTSGWKNYISGVITKNIKDLTRANVSGTCYVTFIVDTEGNITNVEALNMEGSLLASISTGAIKKGPNWVPAIKDGKKVKFFQIQPITFQLMD